METVAIARIALAILWGAALCGLGYLALASMTFGKRAEEDTSGLIIILLFLFVAALLGTLAAADIFNVIDWVWRKK